MYAIAPLLLAFAALPILALPFDNPLFVRSAPANWPSTLEEYSVYHARYESFDCEDEHNNPTFFDACCNPLPKGKSASSLPAMCTAPIIEEDDACEEEPTETTASAPKPTSGVITGGFATWYYQKGKAGTCGHVYKDTDVVVELDDQLFVSSDCGKKITVTNLANHKSVTAPIVGKCTDCPNKNSVNLSLKAFTEIAAQSAGEVKVSWKFD